MGVLQFVVAFFPYHEPRDGDGDEAQAYGVGDGGGQGEALGGYAYIGGADKHHEETWEEGYPIDFMALGEIDADGEESEDGEGLVEPGEVAPEDVEIDEHKHYADGEDGGSQHEALVHLVLLELHKVGCN